MTRKRKEEIQKEIISVEKKFEDLSFPTLFTGRQVFLKDLLAPEDIWRIVTERKEEDKIFKTTKYVITYEGIKKIAKAAGITRYDAKLLVSPTIENKYTCVFWVEIFAGEFRIYGKVGSANEENTSGIARRHKEVIAEKRGYSRAVIEFLGLPYIYGEDEITSEDDERIKTKTGLKQDDFEEIKDWIKLIVESTEIKSLKDVGKKILEKITEFSEEQVEYLRKLYGERIKTIQGVNF